MSSVMAIVSKALFEKMIPKKDAVLGKVVDTDRYTSNNKTFESLEEGGAIFLVTVRPPKESLWLVGILEDPEKKGDAWVSEPNTVPLTDITSAIKKFVFESGSGLKPKKGALGMSLQTPRALTDDDVKLLRSFVKTTAGDAYKAAVDEVVSKPLKTRLGKFRLEKKRKPFEGKLKDLEDWEKAQIKAVSGEMFEELFSGKAADGDEGSEMAQMEIADVVDTTTGSVVYQLMLWPYGDGAIVHDKTTKVFSYICQHGLDPVEEVGKAWTRDFAHAWYEGAKRLKLWAGHIDFDEDDLGEEDDDD